MRGRGDGDSKLFEIRNGVWLPCWAGWAPNQWQHTWGMAAAKALGWRNSGYFINTLYVEFQRTVGDVSIPSFQRGEGREYYENLQATGDRDYLRLPIEEPPTLGVVPGYEDIFDADAGEGNMLTFRATTAGLAGVNGVNWTDDAKVCGWALVAAPVWNDRTRDVLYSRNYYTVDQQTYKPASAQLGIMARVKFALE